MRKTIGFFSAGLVCFTWATAVSAQAPAKPDGYPERAIGIIVPYGAGGGSDQVARAWSKAMQTVTGAAYQVQNKPGGGGLAAIPDFLSRPKDGYTVL
jgi:tripartite-type tricarboxylate transporter receptor subunit TctC